MPPGFLDAMLNPLQRGLGVDTLWQPKVPATGHLLPGTIFFYGTSPPAPLPQHLFTRHLSTSSVFHALRWRVSLTLSLRLFRLAAPCHSVALGYTHQAR
jgi:hypothetical protein